MDIDEYLWQYHPYKMLYGPAVLGGTAAKSLYDYFTNEKTSKKKPTKEQEKKVKASIAPPPEFPMGVAPYTPSGSPSDLMRQIRENAQASGLAVGPDEAMIRGQFATPALQEVIQQAAATPTPEKSPTKAPKKTKEKINVAVTPAATAAAVMPRQAAPSNFGNTFSSALSDYTRSRLGTPTSFGDYNIDNSNLNLPGMEYSLGKSDLMNVLANNTAKPTSKWQDFFTGLKDLFSGVNVNSDWDAFTSKYII
jgi:hypothetical protein